MKLIIPALLCASLCGGCIFGFNNADHVGNGNWDSDLRTLEPFDSLLAASFVDVHYSAGDSHQAYVECDRNLLDVIETNVQADVLVIENNGSVWTNLHCMVQVTAPVLKEVTVTGSGNIDGDGFAGIESVVSSGSGNLYLPGARSPGVTMSVYSEGSGNLDMHGIDANVVHIDQSGSGDIALQGAASRLEVNTTSSGNLSAEDLWVSDAEVTCSGSGNVTLHASGSVDATVEGSGNIAIYGNPASITQSSAGSGNISVK